MARRRNRRKNRARTQSTDPIATAVTRTDTQATAVQDAAPPMARIVPWRDRMRGAMQHLHTWLHDTHRDTLDAYLAQAAGDVASLTIADRDLLVDAYACATGSAPDGRSLVRACAAGCTALDDEARDQLLRWEKERRPGVFVVQRAHKDAIETWDPIEGAPLTLHLLEPPTARERACLVAGTVMTATFRPWLARLVIAQTPDYFAGDEALPLFRREVMESGTQWHDVPSAAPVRSTRRS